MNFKKLVQSDHKYFIQEIYITATSIFGIMAICNTYIHTWQLV